MNVAKSLASGLAAAVSVTLMHELARKTMPHAPRLDVLGMRAVARISRAAGHEPPDRLRRVAFAGDIAANTLYYSLAGLGGPRRALAVGAAIGAVAAVGSLAAPGPLGLGAETTTRTPATAAMAAGMYFAAGLVAGALIQQGSELG